MEEIRTYKVGMKLKGRLTLLPDSQKIFGALTYLLGEYTTSENAGSFVADVKERKVFCSLSDMLPEGFLPVPQTWFLDRVDKSDGIAEPKKLYKAIKQRQYMDENKIMQMMDNPRQIENSYPYISVYNSHQIHASLESLQYGLPGLDPEIYSVPECIVEEVRTRDGREERTQVTDFCFYLGTDKGEKMEQLIQIIKKAQEQERLFFLGARSSQGMNTFVIKDITAVSRISESNAVRYLNLGMLLPDKIDFNKSYLKIFTSERRPFHMPGGWEKDVCGQVVSFIQQGSIIYPLGDPGSACKCIQSVFDENAILFGNAFMLPMNY